MAQEFVNANYKQRFWRRFYISSIVIVVWIAFFAWRTNDNMDKTPLKINKSNYSDAYIIDTSTSIDSLLKK